MRWVARPPLCQRGVQKNIFDISRYLAPKLALVPEKALILQYRYMIYECMCQVSLGLKEDEEGSQAPPTPLGSYFPVQNWLFSTLLGLLLRN